MRTGYQGCLLNSGAEIDWLIMTFWIHNNFNSFDFSLPFILNNISSVLSNRFLVRGITVLLRPNYILCGSYSMVILYQWFNLHMQPKIFYISVLHIIISICILSTIRKLHINYGPYFNRLNYNTTKQVSLRIF